MSLQDKLKAHPLALHHSLNTSLLHYCSLVKRLWKACVHHVSIQGKCQEALPNSSVLESLSNKECHTESQNIILKDPSWRQKCCWPVQQNNLSITLASNTLLPRLQGAGYPWETDAMIESTEANDGAG